MTNTIPSTASTPVSRAAVDEAVRIAADSSRRTTDTAQAAIAAGQQVLDFANQINRDVLSLWTTVVETSLKTTFDAQNAALTSSQTRIRHVREGQQGRAQPLGRGRPQAQATTLKTYQSSTKLVGSLTHQQ